MKLKRLAKLIIRYLEAHLVKYGTIAVKLKAVDKDGITTKNHTAFLDQGTSIKFIGSNCKFILFEIGGDMYKFSIKEDEKFNDAFIRFIEKTHD